MSGNTTLSNWELVRRGIIDENTIFRMAISLCPAIAVTANLKNGFLMGVAVLFVQVMVNVTISSMRQFIHPRIRLPIFMLVISGWVSITDMSMAAFAQKFRILSICIRRGQQMPKSYERYERPKRYDKII